MRSLPPSVAKPAGTAPPRPHMRRKERRSFGQNAEASGVNKSTLHSEQLCHRVKPWRSVTNVPLFANVRSTVRPWTALCLSRSRIYSANAALCAICQDREGGSHEQEVLIGYSIPFITSGCLPGEQSQQQFVCSGLLQITRNLPYLDFYPLSGGLFKPSSVMFGQSICSSTFSLCLRSIAGAHKY